LNRGSRKREGPKYHVQSFFVPLLTIYRIA
jgi:hypothetical protein